MCDRRIRLIRAGHMAHRLQYISEMQQKFTSVESVVHYTPQVMLPAAGSRCNRETFMEEVTSVCPGKLRARPHAKFSGSPGAAYTRPHEGVLRSLRELPGVELAVASEIVGRIF